MTGSAVNPVTPHTFPYLVDKFFYTGASSAADTGGTLVGSPTGDGWFKMFEFFEVPSQMMGATGPVAQGTNFDWDRQDTKPGLLNLNLIIDEEVFFSVFGQPGYELQPAALFRPVAEHGVPQRAHRGVVDKRDHAHPAGRGDPANAAGGDRNPGPAARCPDHPPAHRRPPTR